MGKKLYVGNLSYNVKSSDLESPLAVRPDPEREVIEDRETGRSKGFGFVEMSSDAEAQAAIRGLHEQDHEGRPLTVNEAKPAKIVAAVAAAAVIVAAVVAAVDAVRAAVAATAVVVAAAVVVVAAAAGATKSRAEMKRVL